MKALVAVSLLVGVALAVSTLHGSGETAAGRVAAQSVLERLRAVTAVTCSPARRHEAIVAGSGPVCAPFDSIPAVDEPRFEAPALARLGAADPVVALAVDGDARAYPVRYLLYHEVVNDTVAGVPVLVTYCPLCDSAAAFTRRVAGRILTFGVSGELEYANLRMFDRQTLTRWQQISGRAVGGELEGARLQPLPAAVVAWGSWRAAHPTGRVLAAPSDSFRYGIDPYQSYDAGGPRAPSPVLATGAEPGRGNGDGRLPPKERIVGVVRAAEAVAFVSPRTRSSAAVAHAELAGGRLVAFFRRGTALTGRELRLRRSPRGWSATVWVAHLQGRALRFRGAGRAFLELRTGSRFDAFGRGLSGPLAGRRLRAVRAQTSYWFAWSHFEPETRIVKAS